MRFTYKNKKMIVDEMRRIKKVLWSYVELQEVIHKLHWEEYSYKFSIKNYSYESLLYLNTGLVNNVIKFLEEITVSKSQYVDFDEIKSDLEFIKQYYYEKYWTQVIVWLSNTESSLNWAFSDYMEEIKNSQRDKQKIIYEYEV